jgi:hypothetical protein
MGILTSIAIVNLLDHNEWVIRSCAARPMIGTHSTEVGEAKTELSPACVE